MRDGLKPSQRRILCRHARSEPGAAAPSTASARRSRATRRATTTRTAQEVIYPTLLRMAQEWNLRYPLVDGQGNFGSRRRRPAGGDALHRGAHVQLRRGDAARTSSKDTVDFVPNYDETTRGADGPARPLPEPARATAPPASRSGWRPTCRPTTWARSSTRCRLLIDDPDSDARRADEGHPGPGLPHRRASSWARAGIREAYETGRGSITMQARAIIEPLGRRQARRSSSPSCPTR